MRQKYKEHRFKTDDLKRIDLINSIIDDYLAQGLRLTLRQLYYQLVTRNEIPNKEASYTTLGNLLVNARMAGAVDWSAIEDRGREPIIPQDWPGGVSQLVTAAAKQYRLPRWRGQTKYAELWVEKQALAGVLESLAYEHHVTLMVNKGYSSASAMHASAQRYIQQCVFSGKIDCTDCNAGMTRDGDICGTCRGVGEVQAPKREPWLFYLGDHDPSGEDMVRDIKERLETFGVDGIRVFKIALTMPQIERFKPPPNPAKLTDSRATKYVQKYGDESWEVDALPPAVLADIVRNAFKRIIDQPVMDKVIEDEREGRSALERFAAKFV